MEEAVRRALGVAAGSVLGVAALVLARAIDDPGTSAAARVSCVRELGRVLDRLRGVLPAAEGRLDELALRRRGRVSG